MTSCWWDCSGDATSCDTQGEWDEHVTNLTGTVESPKVTFAAGAHAFVAYEDAAANLIRLAYRCWGDSDFTHAGPLAPPAGNYNVFRFGYHNGDSVQEVRYDLDSDTIHVVFLGREDDDEVWNPLHWHDDVADWCP